MNTNALFAWFKARLNRVVLLPFRICSLSSLTASMAVEETTFKLAFSCSAVMFLRVRDRKGSGWKHTARQERTSALRTLLLHGFISINN